MRRSDTVFLALSLALLCCAPGAIAEYFSGSTKVDNSLDLRFVPSPAEDWRTIRSVSPDLSRTGSRYSTSEGNRCPLATTVTASDGTKLILPRPPLCLKLPF